MSEKVYLTPWTNIRLDKIGRRVHAATHPVETVKKNVKGGKKGKVKGRKGKLL